MNAALSLDLLSWNLHGPPFAPRRTARFAAAAAEIVRRAPEVALLQEVWFRRDAAQLTARLSPAYDVLDCMPRSWPMRPSGLLAFVRRDGAWSAEAANGHFERYRDAAGRWRLWEGDGIGAKGIQLLPFVHRAGGQRLVVLHTHVQAQYDTIRHARPRAAQLRQLTALAATVEMALPVVAAGDLNTGPDEPLYPEIIAPAWIDLTAATRAANPTAATQFDCGAEPLWIDYVLARRSDQWRVAGELALIENVARDDPYSDHHGLHARIAISPSGDLLNIGASAGVPARSED